MKAYPYAFYSQTLKQTASVVCDGKEYEWNDESWLKCRRKTICPPKRGKAPKKRHYYSAPLNIYEMHLGS